MLGRIGAFGLCLSALIAMLLAAAPATGASLALVLAVDVSASVTADSYVLQREGIARAFESATVVEAIAAAPGGIEALFLQWSDPEKIEVAVEWTRMADGKSAAGFSAAVRAARRSSEGLTAIGAALLAAAAQFERMPVSADRWIVDVSGDGMANFGLPPAIARDRIVAAGISINGLAILTEEPWLEGYYRSNVIGGAGAFVAIAKDFHSFAEAMTRKLVREIAGAVPGRHAGAAMPEPTAAEPGLAPASPHFYP
jgi:hypothetical protein